MPLTIQSEVIPLRVDDAGTIRVGTTRVLLELVVHAFREGATPEDIVQMYDTLDLADVYAVTAYYLRHQEEIEWYIREREKEAVELRKKVEAVQRDLPDIRQRLLNRKMLIDGGRNVTTDSLAARERRVRQFEHYLALMEHRTCQLAKSDCFLIFSIPIDPEVQKRLGSETRIVQFAFMQSGFYLDLPDTTLTPEEAKIALNRPGFGFALNNSQKRFGERQYDPVQRQYQYSQQRTAAEDTAYVFFDLWQAPLDTWIKVTASAFETADRWEHDFSMG